MGPEKNIFVLNSGGTAGFIEPNGKPKKLEPVSFKNAEEY